MHSTVSQQKHFTAANIFKRITKIDGHRAQRVVYGDHKHAAEELAGAETLVSEIEAQNRLGRNTPVGEKLSTTTRVFLYSSGELARKTDNGCPTETR